MCMGRTHVLAATAISLAAAAPLSTEVMHRQLPVGSLLVFAVITGGYGVLPDFDHPSATLARTLGPATKAIATFIHAISGGHRKGTHTIRCAALMVGLVTFLSVRFGNEAELPVAFIGFYLFAMILKLAPNPSTGGAEFVYLLEAAAATTATYYLIADWWWLPWAVGFGVIGHIAADCLTTQGVPILYPILPRIIVKLPILGSTDSAREHGLAWLLVPAIAWGVFALLLGHQWWTVEWLRDPNAWRIAASR
jgi:membrane-bound metal-dependent hydrolase YbcI (DUF457 family)